MPTYFTITLGGGGGGLPQIYNIIRALYPLFSGGYSRLGKHVRIKSYAIFLNFREASENTPYLGHVGRLVGFLGKIFPRQTAKKIFPFPRKLEYACGPLVHSRGGGGDPVTRSYNGVHVQIVI